jgi:hypothetical protein
MKQLFFLAAQQQNVDVRNYQVAWLKPLRHSQQQDSHIPRTFLA